MLPLRPASLFRSRWAALFYAAGVAWFALDVAGAQPEASGAATASENAATTNDADLARLEARVSELHNLQ